MCVCYMYLYQLHNRLTVSAQLDTHTNMYMYLAVVFCSHILYSTKAQLWSHVGIRSPTLMIQVTKVLWWNCRYVKWSKSSLKAHHNLPIQCTCCTTSDSSTTHSPALEHWHTGQRYCLPPSINRANGFM